MKKSAVTFCPENSYELERLLAYVKRHFLYDKLTVFALDKSIRLVEQVSERHPELDIEIFNYPENNRYPGYFDPEKLVDIDCSDRDGIVLISGEAASFAFMKNLHEAPVKPFYNLFRILHRLGVKSKYCFTVNHMEKINIEYLLDDFKNTHKGKRCFIAGNGPSLKNIDMQKMKDEITFGSNRVYMGFKEWGYNFKYWGIVDNRQIECYPEEWEDKIPEDVIKFLPFEYTKILKLVNSCPVNTFNNTNYHYPYNFINPTKNKKQLHTKFIFSTEEDIIYLGWTVTYMLLQIAVVMGCNPIYLVGLDHKYNIDKKEREKGVWKQKNAENHFHKDYGKDKLFNLPDEVMMEKFFDHAFEFCKSRGVDIYNATPGTALESFPLVDYDSLFNEPIEKAVVLSIEKECQKIGLSSSIPLIFITDELSDPFDDGETCVYRLRGDSSDLARNINDILDSHLSELFVVVDRGECTEMPEGWLSRMKEAIDEYRVSAVVASDLVTAGNCFSLVAEKGVLVSKLGSMRFSEFYSNSYFIEDYCLRLWELGEKICGVPLALPDVQKRKINSQMHFIDKSKFLRDWQISKRLSSLLELHTELAGGLDFQKLLGLEMPKDDRISPARLLSLLVTERIKATSGCKGRRVVFGAGEHTKWLEKICLFGDDIPEIDIVIDDNPVGKKDFFGKQVIKTEDFNYKTDDIIILSSDCHQPLMAARCRALFGCEAEIIDLYKGLPRGPHEKEQI